MRHLPSFRALRCFELAARTGSLTAAARELNVTTGAVSRQISALEERIGVTLMHRGATGITVTEPGRTLHQRLSQAFGSIEAALDEITRTSTAAPITISVYPTIAIQWLVPRLPDLFAIAPELDLSLRPSLQHRPFDREEIDIAISIGVPDDPRLHTRVLLRRLFTPVCSPETLKLAGADIATSLHGTRIFYSDRQIAPWRRWLAAAGHDDLDLPRIGIRFENSSLAYQAAREGIGFAIGQPAMLRNDLESGRLVAPFSRIVESDTKYLVECRQADRNRPAIRSFMDWIIAEAEKTEKLLAPPSP